MANDEQMVTLGDAARELGMPYATVYGAFSKGRIEYQRAGTAILVKVSDVRAAFAAYRPRPIAQPQAR